MNIAILEDNPAILDYLATALKMNGHHAQIYTHGEPLLEALFPAGQALSPPPFDLILVDLLLPGDITGFQVMQTIRQSFSYERLPIIIVSASSPKELERAQAEFPHTPVIRKPFKVQELLSLINTIKK